MSTEPELKLLLDLDPEVARWRRRSTFLLSLIFHGLLIIFLLVSPQLFRRGADFLGIVQPPEQKRELSYLWISPQVLKRLQQPPETNLLSDQNRRAQGRSPVVDPNGLHMPYLRGNSQVPEIAGGPRPQAPPAAAAPSPPPAGAGASAQPAPPPPPKKEDGLRLADVEPESGGSGNSQLRLKGSTAGESNLQALEGAVRDRSSGATTGPGDSFGQFNNLDPNFSVQGPVILSDTRGVDFGPYLARVVMAVRQNWLAMIPEAARLGQKGRVAIVFEILKDGSVPQLRMLASSGEGSLDRAALGAIRASNPFPPLPQQFTGNHLVLEFIFLYNIGIGP